MTGDGGNSTSDRPPGDLSEEELAREANERARVHASTDAGDEGDNSTAASPTRHAATRPETPYENMPVDEDEQVSPVKQRERISA
jgi:hypothetical protein